MTLPNPGSDEARAQGCICPVMDNGHGHGHGIDEHGEPFFVQIVGCPLHDPMPKRKPPMTAWERRQLAGWDRSAKT